MPFFERIYRTVKDFCDDLDDDISINILCECLQQLLDNKLQPELLQIPVPEDFITDEKVGIWKTLKKKLKTCLGVGDSVYKSIDIIWSHWSRLLFEKELKDRKDAQSSVTLYPASPIFSLTPASSQSPLIGACSYTYTPSSSIFSSTDPSPFSNSPGYVLTPTSNSVTSSISSPHSSDSYNTSSNNSMGIHESVKILKNFSVRVMTMDGHPFGSFHYAKKENEKYICQTDGCKMTTKKECKIRNEGVTRETLIGHATKYHSISLNLKKKIGILQKGFACALCSESFTRPQTLSNHTKKFHEAPQLEETWLNQSWEPTLTYTATVPITSDSSAFTFDEIESLSYFGNDNDN